VIQEGGNGFDASDAADESVFLESPAVELPFEPESAAVAVASVGPDHAAAGET